MADPLSTAGGVVGIISLGIQVTQSLYDYYAAFKSQPSDVGHTLQKLQSLQTVLQQLLSHLTDRSSLPGDLELKRNIECTVQQCEECIKELEEEVGKFKKTKTDSFTSNLKATGRRLAYPFRQSTLQKLDEDIDDLVSRLSLALSLLQQKTIDRIQDDVQNTRAVLDLIRAKQVSGEIQDWLKAPDASINFNENHKKKHPGTGLWFTEGSAFATWLDQPNSFLWLRGFAGCGKSVLCSTAIQHAMRRRGFESAPSRVGVAFFFFTFNDNTKQSTSAMLRALILQLSGQARGTPDSLTALHKDHKPATPPESSLLECLRQILLSFRDIYILLDALDESSRGTHREAVLDALNEIRGWTGTHLHLLVTSRDEVDIRDSLQATSEETISLQNGGIDRDIVVFVSQHLRDNRRLHKWKDSYDEIESILTQKAKGVFRWVECQFREIASCPRSQSLLDELLSSLPPTLDETYERMIQNIPSISKQYARQMLTILCCATRPLTIPELIDAIAVDLSNTAKFDTRRRLTDVEGLQEVCPGFTETDFNEKTGSITIRLAHFSVQEYLESGRISEDSHAAPFIIRRSHGHTAMASICLTFLLEPRLLALDPEEARVEFPLAQYAAKEWPHHYTKSTKTESLNDQTIQLMAKRDEPFQSWVRIWNVLDDLGKIRRTNIPPALYYASRLGIQPVLEHLCRTQNPSLSDILNAQYGEYETPLQAAAGNGHEEAVGLLLKKGANAKAACYYAGGIKSNSLIAAARFGSCKIAEMLLNAGANVNAVVGYHINQTTALREAAQHGHYDFVKWLLGHGVEVNHKACSHSALVSASAIGHLDMAKTLIDAGAQVNVRSGYRTPLAAASGGGHTNMVKLLLENGADPRIKCWLTRPRPQTAFEVARENKRDDAQKKLIEWFVENVTNPTEEDISNYGTCLEEAAKTDDVRLVDLLLTWRNDNAPRGSQNNALQHACSRGHEKTVVLLLEKGLDGNQQFQHSYDNGGHSELGYALQSAAANCHTHIVELLLAKGSERAEFFLSPFHLSRALQEASAGGHLNMVILLLDAGAKPSLLRIGSPNMHVSRRSGIIEASRTGNIDIFNLFMARGAKPFQEIEEYNGALTAASANGHLAVVQRLLDQNANFDTEAGKHGRALSAASAGGYQEIVQKLLENGADIKDTTALQNASAGGFTSISKLLLNHGADPNAPPVERNPPLGTALFEASGRGHEKIVQLLLQSGASVSAESPENKIDRLYYRTPLVAASGMGHTAIVRHLLLHVTNSEGATSIDDTEWTESMHYACAQGWEETVRLLVDNGADVNALRSQSTGSRIRTAISAAAMRNHLNIVRYLLSRGARADDQIREHTSPLGQAAHLGEEGTMNSPIQRRAEANSDIAYTDQMTAVAAAVEFPDILQLLLDRGGDVNSENDRRITALQLAAVFEQKDSMKLLLKMGANVNSNQGENGTALQIASKRGRKDLVMMLLDAGADVNLACGNLPTALQAVCHKGGHGDLAELLLKYNADPNMLGGQRGTALIAASTEGYLEIVTLLLANGADVNLRSERYGSALTTAITEGHVDIAKVLLDHNADPNIRGGEHYETALQAAVCEGQSALIEILIQHGADVNAKEENKDRGTPLNSAIIEDDFHTAELLLRFGADPNIDGGGKVGLPLFEAICWGNYDAVKMLLDHGARTDLPNGIYHNAMEAALDDGDEDIIELVKGKSLEISLM